MTSAALPTAADNAPPASVLICALPTTPSAPVDGPLSFSDLLGQAKISPEPTAVIPSALLMAGDAGQASDGVAASENEEPAQSAPNDSPMSIERALKEPDRGTLPGRMMHGRLGGTSARQILMRPGVSEEESVDAAPSNRVGLTSPQSSPRREKSAVSIPTLPDANESSALVNVVPLSAEMAAVVMPIVDFKVQKPLTLRVDSGADEMTAAPRSGEIEASAGKPVQGMQAMIDRGAPSVQIAAPTIPVIAYADARSVETDPSTTNEQPSPITVGENPSAPHLSKVPLGENSPAIDMPSPMSAEKPGENVAPHAAAANKISIQTAPAKTEEKNAPAENIFRSLPMISSREPANDNFLNIDGKELTRSVNRVGTEVAKDDSTMATRFNAPTSARDQEGVFPVRSDVVNSVSAPVVQASAGTGQVTEAHVSRAAEAVEVIREVISMTDDLRSRERSSVEVQFHFKDNARVDVRVVYRDGEVQATFRSDSPELRDTLHREWQMQAGAASSEARPYRLAEPVFLSTTTISAQPSGLGFGGDSSRQSSQQQPRPDTNGLTNVRQSSALGDGRILHEASSRPAASVRPDTVRHLHVFA